MTIVDRINAYRDDMIMWRHDLHAHPETAFEEYRTSDFVAEKLTEYGVDVHRGLARTGVVGILRNGEGSSIGLRADMDALNILEQNNFPHRSVHEGKMHACGHDGHTAMLLGAARYLAETKNFAGTVYFIFQPAEENEGGGRVMVEEGLFDRYPMEGIYGMHNWPGLAAGQIAVRAGPVMAAVGFFEIEVVGRGTHGAMPHTGVDPIIAAAEIVSSLQIIASRNTDPLDAVVVSVTKFQAGDGLNTIPDRATIGGTTRALKLEVIDTLEPRIRQIAEGIGLAYGVTVQVTYRPFHPATMNHCRETEIATSVAAQVVGMENVITDAPPSMASEDFAHMLAANPGCYVWLGNGPMEGGCLLHNARYDFNDAILPTGATYWAKLVETSLSKG